MISSLERSLKEKVEKILQPQANIPHIKNCWYCGFRSPAGINPYPECGRPAQELNPLEKRVFDYISSHGYTISLSKAAQDLAVSPALLSQAIEQLKAIGILKQS